MSVIRTAWDTWWLQWTWPFKLGSIAVVLVVIIFIVAGLRGCGKRTPSLDQNAIIEAQKAIEKNDRRAMIEVLAESDVKELQIDNSIKAAEQATEKQKRSYAGKTNEELAAELNRRANP